MNNTDDISKTTDVSRTPMSRNIAGIYQNERNMTKQVSLSGVSLELQDDILAFKIAMTLFRLQKYEVTDCYETVKSDLFPTFSA